MATLPCKYEYHGDYYLNRTCSNVGNPEGKPFYGKCDKCYADSLRGRQEKESVCGVYECSKKDYDPNEDCPKGGVWKHPGELEW